MSDWKTQGEGPTWMPTLASAELYYKIPTDLLARIAYQESHFRQDIIDGTVKSSAGAVGIMQLMPEFFPGAGVDPQKDIYNAARFLASLYVRFHDWTLAVAAYNDGPGNVQKYLNGTKVLPAETTTYVADVTADVPLTGVLA